MKTLIAFLALTATGLAQVPVPQPSPKLPKEEIAARMQAQIAEQRAKAAQAAVAEKTLREEEQKAKAAYQAEIASCHKIAGSVDAVQREGIRITAFLDDKAPLCTIILVGYSQPVNWHQPITIFAKPDGTRTYMGIDGFNITVPAFQYFADVAPKVKDNGKIKYGQTFKNDAHL